MNKEYENKYWQIEIADETSLSGMAMARLIEFLSIETGSSFLFLRAVEGGGARISEVSSENGETVYVEDFLSIAKEITQFDWGDFYLCVNEDEASRIQEVTEYPQSLRLCEVLVRAVDDTYFYIYGKDERLKLHIIKRNTKAKVKLGSPESLDFPW